MTKPVLNLFRARVPGNVMVDVCIKLSDPFYYLELFGTPVDKFQSAYFTITTRPYSPHLADKTSEIIRATF